MQRTTFNSPIDGPDGAIGPPSGSRGPSTFIGTWVIAFIILTSAPSMGRAQTIGLQTYEPGNLDGFVLFSPIPYTVTYLIDKCGRPVHTWPSAYKPGQSVYLMDDGSLMRTGTIPNANFPAGGRGGVIERIAWDGTVLWSCQISDADQCSHHDIHPMPNGHVLVIAWDRHPAADAIARGRDPGTLVNFLWSEKVMEIAPVGSDQADVVWEWRLWDHLVQDLDSTKPGYGVVADHPELLDLNYVNGAQPADWIHANSIDYDEQLDQVLLSSHNVEELWVIDHGTSTLEAASHSGGAHGHGGDLLYRWGNPRAYGRGTEADQRFYGQHNAQWIREDLPYAGGILVFNNGLGRPDGAYSSIDIITPPVDGNGDYAANGPDAFAPTDQVYTWTAEVPTDFYAMLGSGAQLLPNGGSIVCDGPAGTFIELDPGGAEVWRYVSPVNNGGPMTQGATPTGNAVFRCTWVAADHPGLAGHDLLPGEPIELEPMADACSSTGGPEPAGRQDTGAYPNPTHGHVRLHVQAGWASLTIADAQGRVVRILEGVAQNNVMDLDLSSVANGTYSLLLQQGDRRWQERIMLAH